MGARLATPVVACERQGMRSLASVPLAALWACAPDASLELSVTPHEVPADGVASALLVARPVEGDQPAPEGTRVTFQSTLGSFHREDPSVRELVRPVALGTVEVRLFSPAKPGQAKVRAEFLTATGEKIEGKVEVRFTEPPAAAGLTLGCEARNLGALVSGAPLLKAECRATALDAGGAPAPAAPLGFMAEAGRLAIEDAPGLGRRLVYSTGTTPPLDVAPREGEPRWPDGPLTRNPRDGVVTLVAYAERPAPSARAQGEPFVDADDSGAYERGEVYFDMDGDSEYDPPQSGVAAVWAMTRLVWSGDAETTPLTAPEPAALSIADGGSEPVLLSLADKNLNPLAVGRGGLLTLSAGPVAVVAPREIGLADNSGFALAADGSIASSSGWMLDVGHTVWVRDGAPDSESDEGFALTGTVVRQLTPGVAGGIAPIRTEPLPPIPGVLRAR